MATPLSDARTCVSPSVDLQEFVAPAGENEGGKDSSIPAPSPAHGAGKPRDQTVPTACLSCRSKHLKCDGKNPCLRCLSSKTECVYIASRRGNRAPRRGSPHRSDKRQSSPSLDMADGPASLLSKTGGMLAGFDIDFASLARASAPTSAPRLADPETPWAASEINGASLTTTIDPTLFSLSHQDGSLPPHMAYRGTPERCIDAFYYHFFAAHPFVLPRDHLLPLAEGGGLQPLLASMCLIGSMFIDCAAGVRGNLLKEAYHLTYSSQTPRDGFLVQAMMLLVLALDGNAKHEKAMEVLEHAERLALDINLNTRAFATLHGRGMAVLEESWRRTWWDLFIIDGMIASVHQATGFALFDVPADVALPCEEYQYFCADIPSPLYLDDLEEQGFSDANYDFSSFAFRILCLRNLGRLMRTPPSPNPDDENIARLETLLSSWRLHLPKMKQDALYQDGRQDEMMFQAQMMLHATSILLHQPYSQLDTSPAHTINSCSPHQNVAFGDLFNTHTKHIITSACEISSMITHRVPLLSHTPFFTCIVTLSSIVHLSRWANLLTDDEDDVRQLIRLNLGALDRLSKVWGNADKAREQVHTVAKEIYQAKKQRQLNLQMWEGLTRETIENIAADDSIIADMDGLRVPTDATG